MAASTSILPPVGLQEPSGEAKKISPGVLLASYLTLPAVLIHGYHPYAEDGGLYLAGVKRLIYPDLYPYWTGFTTAHLRFSAFAPFAAFLTHATHLSLMTVMLLLYIGSIWLTLLAGWHLAVRCYSDSVARMGAVLLLGALLTVPVAGTSLMLMDPYVSARSLSTPCGLFALVATIDMARQLQQHGPLSYRTVILFLSCLFIGFIMHPLMTAYVCGCVLVYGAASVTSLRLRWALYGTMMAATLCVAAGLTRFASPSAPGYVLVARTRTYWFPGCWHWYELLGIAAPLLVLAVTWRRERNCPGRTACSLAQMGVLVGLMATIVATLFARIGFSNYAVARLQPLRVLQTVYVLTILFVGATVARHVLKRSVWRWIGAVGSTAAIMMFVQIATFPNSPHLEFPWTEPGNGWEQAFTWIRNNTSKKAIFALDADYIVAPGEDSQNFRAIAERSAVPDSSKDGGVASIAPDLTAAWVEGERIQRGLEQASDLERVAVLRPASVSWVVLSNRAITAFKCDYANGTAKVCRVPKDIPTQTTGFN